MVTNFMRFTKITVPLKRILYHNKDIDPLHMCQTPFSFCKYPGFNSLYRSFGHFRTIISIPFALNLDTTVILKALLPYVVEFWNISLPILREA
eukprot:snap_masked-scaffold_20-processed-gene-5.79-mRNA-1 protein AED:1.00 eAED:1.00 QI:0/0/0/0/1/1/2/0/92